MKNFLLFCFVCLFLVGSVDVGAGNLEFSMVNTDEQKQYSLVGNWDWHGDLTSLDVGGKYIKGSGRIAQYDVGMLGKAMILRPFEGRAGYRYFHTHQTAQFGLGVRVGHGSVHAGSQIEYPNDEDKIIYGKAGVDYKRRFSRVGLSWNVDYIFDKHGNDRFDGKADLKVFLKYVYFGVGFSRIRFVEIQRSYVGVSF